MFEKTFHQFSHSTTTFIVFLGYLASLRLLKTKKNINIVKLLRIDLKMIKKIHNI